MGTSVRIQHVAECPEVSPVHCEEYDIPTHFHDQTVDWLRISPGITAGLGKGWQGTAFIPFDAKKLGILYTLDGEVYHPPYEGIHHRNELLAGPADGTLGLERFFGLGDLGMWSLKATTSLPIGRTEEDPFALTLVGEEHQHFQMGTGTFIPSVEAKFVIPGLRIGALGWAATSQPLYENGKGYFPGARYNAGAGVTYRVTPDLNTVLSTEYAYETQDAWDGEPSPASGRQAVVIDVGASWSAMERLTLSSMLRITAWQVTMTDYHEDQLLQRLVATVGASWTFGEPDRSTAAEPNP